MAVGKPPMTLSVPTDPGMLSVVRSFIETSCQIGEFEQSVVFAVVTAVGEAFTNVVRHAHREQPDAPLQIRCRLSEESIEIDIMDQGPRFDLESVPQLDPGALRVGGRGVFLMRTLMDELISSPRPDGGNILQMVKYRQPTESVRNCG